MKQFRLLKLIIPIIKTKLMVLSRILVVATMLKPCILLAAATDDLDIAGRNTNSVAKEVVVDTIESLRKADLSALTQKSIVEVLGYYKPGDGGGGLFYFSPKSTKIENGGAVLGSSNAGRWIRVSNEHRSVLWYGAHGNGVSDDTQAIQNAINDTPDGGELHFPPGQYLVSGVVVNHPIKMTGDGVSKWFGHGAELRARGDQDFILKFEHKSSSDGDVAFGGEVKNLGLNGMGRRFSTAIFVGTGFSEVTFSHLQIGNGMGSGLLLRHWFEGKFDDVFFNGIDAQGRGAVIFIGSVIDGDILSNVNNLRIYNSRFESNRGVAIRSVADSNLDILTVTNSKFEWSAASGGVRGLNPLFDLECAFRVDISGNSITQYSAGRGFSPLVKVGGGARGNSGSRGAALRFSNNDLSGLDANTVLVDAGPSGTVRWIGNTMMDSVTPNNPFVFARPERSIAERTFEYSHR